MEREQQNTPKPEQLFEAGYADDQVDATISKLDLIEEKKYVRVPAVRNDDLAQQELESKFKDGVRGESYRSHIHRIVVCAMYIVSFVMIALVLIRAYHFVAPASWRWMTDKESHDLERIIFSGVIFSVMGRYFSKFNIVPNR